MKLILKTIWKRRKRNRFLLLEFLISFIVLFAVAAVVVTLWTNYNKPLGFNYNNVWDILYSVKGEREGRDIGEEQKEIIQRIQSFEEVEYVTKQEFNNVFRFNYCITDKFSYNGEKNFEPYVIGTEIEFAEIFKLNLIEGRWFNKSDDASELRPIVINKKFRDAIFGNRPAIGQKVIAMNDDECIVVGVIDDFRYLGDFSNTRNLMFARQSMEKKLLHNEYLGNTSNWFGGLDIMVARVKPQKDIAFERKLHEDLVQQFPGWDFSITTLEKQRSNYFKRVWIPIIVILLIAGFLIANVILGLFGVLWYNISLRQSEIGLRLSVGATKLSIHKLFVIEMAMMVTLAIIPGLIIAAQFPLLHIFNLESHLYIKAMIIAGLLMYLLVTICALLPGHQATKTQPALALHEE